MCADRWVAPIDLEQGGGKASAAQDAEELAQLRVHRPADLAWIGLACQVLPVASCCPLLWPSSCIPAAAWASLGAARKIAVLSPLHAPSQQKYGTEPFARTWALKSCPTCGTVASCAPGWQSAIKFDKTDMRKRLCRKTFLDWL